MVKLFTVVEFANSTLYNLDYAQIKPKHYVFDKFSVGIQPHRNKKLEECTCTPKQTGTNWHIFDERFQSKFSFQPQRQVCGGAMEVFHLYIYMDECIPSNIIRGKSTLPLITH